MITWMLKNFKEKKHFSWKNYDFLGRLIYHISGDIVHRYVYDKNNRSVIYYNSDRTFSL